MKIQLEINDSRSAVSLDQIINLIVDNAESCHDPSQFGYIESHDKAIMSEIRKYSQGISRAGILDMPGQKSDEMIESMSENLFDVISATNLDYLKHGIKLGARLLMELAA